MKDMKSLFIRNLKMLQVGMKVEVTDIFDTQDKKNAVISGMEERRKTLYIDGKPVSSTSVTAVVVACEEGREFLITPDNFWKYRIYKLK